MILKPRLISLIFCKLSIVSVLSQRCTKEKSEVITYMVPENVIEKYWDQNWLGMWGEYTRYSVKNRKKYFTKTYTEYVCCTGFTEVDNECLPICDPQCPPNSKCTHPFSCTCNEGYRMRSDGSCEPVCNTPCPMHANCVAPNICMCLMGYTMFYNTCTPVCLRQCPRNASCVAPNKCECATGYKMIGEEGQYCEPQCPDGCPENSNCVSPAQCACNEGYSIKVDGSCEPICSTSCPARGHCIAPDTCSCFEGYKFTINRDECVPECKYDCPVNMYCQSPNNCACRTGYAPHSKGTTNKSSTTALSIDECTPVCSGGCPAYSECVGPEECHCLSGYAMKNVDYADNEEPVQGNGICMPICEIPCPQNASCVKPNVCECAIGYEMMRIPQHLDYCQAQCSQNCNVNGKCVAPDVCECFPGFEPVKITKASMDNEAVEPAYCQPVCMNGCPHGDCLGPNMCVCHPGYLMGAGGICEPTCSNGCQNGFCSEPEICACNEGYQLSTTDRGKCEPICSDSCINADCAAPEFCICHDKYKPKFNGAFTNECEPMCSPECVNAECVAPDQCRCHEGYMPQMGKMKTHICLPPSTNGSTSPLTTDVSSTDAFQTTTAMVSTIENIDKDTTELPVVEVFKTNYDEYESSTKLEPNNLKNCKDCNCWKLHPTDKCWEICDLENIACIHPNYTYCNETDNSRMVYKVNGLSKVYTCYPDAKSMKYLTAGAGRTELQVVIDILAVAIIKAINA
ncbi:multiple epidermal growth factor-like domains protein 11 [Ceratitis capitata]|uniref:(Mediterranean fruit fly) hypothetical protein n=2 Tax=Ceratitis capitata TaxID=7213 RepID=A0A811UF34_CERCA|nr:multiple epidermal growth factor-like domains protein 11 [Ceratitis capitata]CAD6997411.1 unnamed protein product [Ceratitis capitata]